MGPKFSIKLVALFMVTVLCTLGYTLMSAQADMTLVAGKVAVPGDTEFKQGPDISYWFFEDTYLDKLELTTTYIRVNEGLKLGASTSAGHINVTLIAWLETTVTGGRQVAEWSAESTVSDADVTFTIYSLIPRASYSIYVDGIVRAQIQTDNSGIIHLAYSQWSTHTFSVLIPTSAIDDETDDSDDGDTIVPTSPTNPVGETNFASLTIILVVFGAISIIIGVALVGRRSGNRNRKE